MSLMPLFYKIAIGYTQSKITGGKRWAHLYQKLFVNQETPVT